MRGDIGIALLSYVCQPVWRSRCHCLLSRWPWSRLWWQRWWPDPPLWRSHGLQRNLIKFRPLHYDWLPLLLCGLRGLGLDPTIFPRLVNPTTVHRHKKKKPLFFFIFLTRYKLVGPVPVGDLGEVSQDTCGFLGLRLQIGRDRVTHCRQAKDELS